MIAVTDLDALVREIQLNVPGTEYNCVPMTGYIMAVHEQHVVIKLADLAGIQLAVIYPSAQRQGKPNSVVEASTTWFWVLEKDDAGQTDLQELEQFQKLQLITEAIINFVDEKQTEGCSILDRYEPGQTEIDPEYRAFGGWNGWSFSLTF